jgi:hypothetical protein
MTKLMRETLYSLETVGMTLSEEQQYERGWAAALVARALERIRAEFHRKADLFAALKPFLIGGVGLPSHEELRHLRRILTATC